MRGERHHRAHDMLDQHDGEAGLAIELAQHADHAVGLGRAQAGHDFVEKQDLRIGGERARDLQPLAVRQRQRRGALMALVVEVETAQHFAGADAGIGDMARGAAARRR